MRYRYSASGEREQKRLYSGPGPDGEAWAYYLLAGRTQHAVYHGMQTVACEQPSTMVFIAPVEYLGYGGGEGLVRYDPTGTRTYTISDHLGSLRALVNDTGTVIRSVDYEPFGEVYAENGQATRREFLNLERDRESALGDHGVRKYDAELGRFVSVDPLWEAYRSVGGYTYAGNNPLVRIDIDGKRITFASQRDRGLYMEALEYLESKDVEEEKYLRDLLESEEYTINLQLTDALDGDIGSGDATNVWDRGGNTLYWNPYAATKYENEDGELERYSPAISLLHEGAHAWLDKNDRSKASATEERWVIQNVETPAIIQSGEATKGRARHNCQGADIPDVKCGISYRTSGPTSRDEVRRPAAGSNPKRRKR